MLRTLSMVVLEGSSLRLSFSKNILTDLKVPSGLLVKGYGYFATNFTFNGSAGVNSAW